VSIAHKGPGPRSRATIRDVAALAGVGTKTVSRVINDEKNVTPATREKVLQAISALRYEPNFSAGALGRSDQKTRAIGVLLSDLANPFSSAIIRAIEDAARPRGVAVFAASLDEDPDQEAKRISAFTRRRVDGLIMMTVSHDQGYLQHEREHGTPIVFVDRPPVGLTADSVVVDNANGSRMAVSHLVDHGHTHIAYLGDNPTIWTARDRRHGFVEAMAVAGADPVAIIEDLRSETAAREAVHAIMTATHRPTALYTSHNLVTIGAIRALRDLGLHREIALVGFDDFSVADLIEPAITVIAQNPREIGRLAA
jgi:LacI family transcriptional regulator